MKSEHEFLRLFFIFFTYLDSWGLFKNYLDHFFCHSSVVSNKIFENCRDYKKLRNLYKISVSLLLNNNSMSIQCTRYIQRANYGGDFKFLILLIFLCCWMEQKEKLNSRSIDDNFVEDICVNGIELNWKFWWIVMIHTQQIDDKWAKIYKRLLVRYMVMHLHKQNARKAAKSWKSMSPALTPITTFLL